MPHYSNVIENEDFKDKINRMELMKNIQKEGLELFKKKMAIMVMRLLIMDL